jgi:hypothetical protein
MIILLFIVKVEKFDLKKSLNEAATEGVTISCKQ